MELSLIIGNIFSFFAAVCVGVSVIKKNKKDFMYWQVSETLFGMIVNIVLCAYTALVISIICFVRNMLSYKNKLTKEITTILLIVSIIVGAYANNLGIIGMLAIFASTSYTICVYITKNEQQMRYATVINMFLWFIHDLYIQAYPSAFASILLCAWTIVQILKNKKFYIKTPVKVLG